MKQGQWIWYPGDFEIYHSLRLNTRREERSYMWPAFWKLDDCYHNVKFEKSIKLDKEDCIIPLCNGIGYIEVDGQKYAYGDEILLKPGDHHILAAVAKVDGLPSIYIEGNYVKSDESWLASYFGKKRVKAGCNHMYTQKDSNPEVFAFEYEIIKHVKQEVLCDGVLYDFGRQTFAKVLLDGLTIGSRLSIYYGESKTEALDKKRCYLYEHLDIKDMCIALKTRAFQYLYVESEEEYELKAEYEYLPLEQQGQFFSSNEQVNKIWDIAEYTFHLNSREFFLDGIKRDRWIWSGDAYQSYQINNYLYFDQELSKRTMIALRGKDPVELHINTILDYSFYWIMGVYEYYENTKDIEFIRFIYERMESLMKFCIERRDERGFVQKVDNDWIFIDWSDMDKTGAVCAEQMLFAKSLDAMAGCCELLEINNTLYAKLSKELKENIDEYFWKDELGAYIDSFESGENHVTRHANLFAIKFGFVDEYKKNKIIEHVLFNETITKITTPYFKFYELDVLAMIGRLDLVTEQILSYWGGMIQLGATTFWEEYDPQLPLNEQYSMYGDPYGKSMCHAWGASPIYLIGKYYMGVVPTSMGYETFDVVPKLGGLDWFRGSVPINGGVVFIESMPKYIKVKVTKNGGRLCYEGREYTLVKDEEFVIPID